MKVGIDAFIDTESAAFMRTNRTGDEVGELRCNFAKYKLAVLDSLAISESRTTGKFVSRTDLVNRIVSEYIQIKIDEARLIQTVLKEYPTVLEDEGG